MKVSSSLSELEASNETVKNGINVGSWNDSWFIAQTRSNHQLGVAMDVSLVQINSTVEKKREDTHIPKLQIIQNMQCQQVCMS